MLPVILVHRVRTDPLIGIIAEITVVDEETGEILHRSGIIRYNGNVTEIARKCLQDAVNDSTERGESQTIDSREEYVQGVYCTIGGD
jgi:hypothetical protein